MRSFHDRPSNVWTAFTGKVEQSVILPFILGSDFEDFSVVDVFRLREIAHLDRKCHYLRCALHGKKGLGDHTKTNHRFLYLHFLEIALLETIRSVNAYCVVAEGNDGLVDDFFPSMKYMNVAVQNASISSLEISRIPSLRRHPGFSLCRSRYQISDT
ncbi:hypothetical protein J6590_024488 [Homalodisca vitripennis]|nr:hypothetical protein J6590_024488 [Homalodisca vitripennis]